MTRRQLDPASLAAALVVAGAAALGIARIGDYDLWHHLRAGELILASGIPTTEPFAYTIPQAPFSLQAWFAEVLFWLAHRGGGVVGVQLFAAVLLGVTFALVLAAARLRAGGRGGLPLAVLLLALAVFATRFRTTPRPQLFEFACLAASLYVLQRWRTLGRGPLWVLPLVQVLWVNCHGSHVLGIAVPALFLGGELVRLALPRAFDPEAAPALPPRRHLAALAAVLAANLVAGLASPQGWHAYTYALRLTAMQTFQANIDEWQPLSATLLFGYGARYTWAFSALVVLAVAGLAARARRRIDPVDLLVAGFFLALSVRAVRQLPDFGISTVPGTFAALAPLAARLERRAARPLAWGALALVVLVAAPVAALDRAYDLGFGVKERVFPTKALAFAERAGVRGNVFNSFAFGDWLVFHAPERKVFIHGWNEAFPDAFYAEYLEAHREEATFRALADRWDVQWLLLEYALTDHGGEARIPHLAANPDWVPIYWDRGAIVYVRRDGPNAAIAERLGLRHLRPAYYAFDYLQPLLRERRAGEVLAEVDALVERAPDNDEAHLAAAWVLYSLRRRDEAMGPLQRAAAISPERASIHSAMGLLLLAQGRNDEALPHLERGLALDPADQGARSGLAKLGRPLPELPQAKMAGHP